MTPGCWIIPRLLLTLDCLNIYLFVGGGFFYFFFIYLVSIYCLLRYSEILGNQKTLMIATYREMETMTGLLNEFGRIQILPPTLILVTVVEITSMFVVIKMHGDISFPDFLIFPTVFGIISLDFVCCKLYQES